MTRRALLRHLLRLTANQPQHPFPTIALLVEEALLSDWKANRGADR